MDALNAAILFCLNYINFLKQIKKLSTIEQKQI